MSYFITYLKHYHEKKTAKKGENKFAKTHMSHIVSSGLQQ